MSLLQLLLLYSHCTNSALSAEGHLGFAYLSVEFLLDSSTLLLPLLPGTIYEFKVICNKEFELRHATFL